MGYNVFLFPTCVVSELPDTIRSEQFEYQANTRTNIYIEKNETKPEYVIKTHEFNLKQQHCTAGCLKQRSSTPARTTTVRLMATSDVLHVTFMCGVGVC